MAQEEQQQNNIQQSNQQTFKIHGMKHDLSESSFENNFAFENMNMRINIVDSDNTLLNLTNERGTIQKTSVVGIPIGVKKYDVNKILLVTTVPNGGATKDKFWNVTCNGDTLSVTMFRDSSNNNVQSDFGFDVTHPLEIEHYKDGERDFFYIADGINNLKTFWVEGPYIYSSNNRLEYNSYISGGEKITARSILYTNTQWSYPYYVKSNIERGKGLFTSGAIIYCFSYITKQGHKTNIIDISELEYIHDVGSNRGNKPNETIECCIRVIVSNLSTEFDKVEIYSLFRSSLDGEITVKKVKTQNITNSTFSIVDYNLGEIISYQELLQRFNSICIPSTLSIKIDSLFLGNIKTNNYSNIKQQLLTGPQLRDINVLSDILNGYQDTGLVNMINNIINGSYIYSNNDYWYGIQLQDKYGNWSPVIKVDHGSKKTLVIPSSYVNKAIDCGYVAVRAMVNAKFSDKKFICQGIMIPNITIDNGKYGVDVYSNYFIDNDFANDIYNGNNVIGWSEFSDIYSPDVEFNELFNISSATYRLILQSLSMSSTVYTNITLDGNTGILYNGSSDKLGKFEYNTNGYIYYDAITGFQKAAQIQFYDSIGVEINNENNWISPLYHIKDCQIHEEPTKYKIYTWQPNGSLNDSNGYTSVLRYKQISKNYTINECDSNSIGVDKNLWLFDGTINNIIIDDNKIYAGIVNFKRNCGTWQITDQPNSGRFNDYPFWDEGQKPYLDNYFLEFLDTYNFAGQPIEVYFNSAWYPIWKYPAIEKGKNDSNLSSSYLITKYWANTTIKTETFNHFNYTIEEAISGTEKAEHWLKTRVTNHFNRPNSIQIGYKTPKHLITKINNNIPYLCTILDKSTFDLNNLNENGNWIPCDRLVYDIVNSSYRNSQLANISSKNKLTYNQAINIPLYCDDYHIMNYTCLKTESYSVYDTNQVCCSFTERLESYINNKCIYDKNLLTNFNGLSSDIINKINLVYNQKNNFFIFSEITSDTVTDDTLENTILYSDTKVANEVEDTFVNLPITNFYTIDSNINKINKLIVYNDKLLCFSDDAIVQILYNENVVINTDSVQSLGLASSDKVTGSQLITNTYGCLNKWSIGISNNVLYFNDDLNRKIFAYDGQFHCLNEELGIQTLNSKLFKNVVWNPNDFGNTKLNIDKYTADIHYTGDDIDIAFNENIGNFTSLYSYEALPYISTIGQHTIGFQNKSGNTYLHFLREGNYNQFFGVYKPFYTTVIINNNSLVTKMLSNVEFSSEAYSLNDGSLLPQHNYTFSHIEFYNDYQRNKVKIDYKLYGQSLLKRKFRIWRINRFRNYTRMPNRNYDMISNPWTYLKLLTEGTALESNRKLTLHWINVNYR